MCILVSYIHEYWLVSTISGQTIQKSGWLSKQMFSGKGYGFHVPVWATPSLFNTNCNSQESDTTTARRSPQLSDLAVVLSRTTAYYIFLKLRGK